MTVFDTNMILRYLIRDNEEQARQVMEILSTNKALVMPEVLAEVVYVLKNFYGCERNTITDTLTAFLSLDCISADHKDVLLKCMELYKNTSLDFVDCLLCAYHIVLRYDISTFDKKLNSLMKRTDEDTTT